MDVSIIIVNYNTCELTRNCLKSIFEQTKDIDFEVIVADNDSHDGSVEMIKTEFPQVILIETGANLGFGRANNRGLAIAKGKYIFYLNSDTILLNNAVKIFFDYFENDKTGEIGALGCNMLDKDHEFIDSELSLHIPVKERCKWGFFELLWLYRDSIKYLFTHKEVIPTHKKQVKEPIYGEVEGVIGADLFVKNNEFAKFDERYFMYCEEKDMQLQMRQAGLKSFLIDGPQIIHLEGASSKKNSGFISGFTSFRSINYNISQCRYLEKNGKIIGGGVFWIGLLKLITLLLWLNPMLIKKTFKEIPYLFKVKY